MKRTFIIILLILLVVNVFALETFREGAAVPNVIIVGFDAEVINTTTGDIRIESNARGMVQIGVSSFDEIANQYGFVDMERMFWVEDQEWCDDDGLYPMNIFRVTLGDDAVINEAFAALYHDRNVKFAEFEAINRPRYIPNDPEFGRQWHLPRIEAPELWDYIQYTGEEVILGIVDSGVRWTHEDLKGNIYINQSQLTGRTINWDTGMIEGVPSTGNYPGNIQGDVIGWNFVYPQNNQSHQHYQGQTHGTHVAGIAGAVGDNSVGVSGVAMYTKILPTRNSPNNASQPTGIQDAYGAVMYVADRGAKVINASWGNEEVNQSSVANNAVNYALNKGAVFVAAAGNSGSNNVDGVSINWPANATNAISVAMLNQQDRKDSGSCYGSHLTISAPGVGIYSTYYTGSQGNTTESYQYATGTSMAAPVVTGVIGMIMAANPHLSPQEIKQRIIDTADPLPEDVPENILYGLLGGGRINAFKSVMVDYIPRLSVFGDIIIEEYEGDGDGIPNIGETISVKISLRNDFDWKTAEGVTATLTTEIVGVDIIQGVLEYGQNINSGNVGHPSNQAIIKINKSVSILEIPFILVIRSNQDASNPYPYKNDIPITIDVSMSKKNWPLELGSESTASPAVADLDGTGLRLVTIAGQNVHVVDHQKKYNPGFPLNIDATIVADFAIGPVARNSNQQIVAATTPGRVLVISHSGEIINEFQAGSQIRNTPIIADLNGDGNMEIIFSTQNGRLFVLNGHDLSVWQNFPIEFEGSITANMSVGDINGDNIKDIVLHTTGTGAGVYVINPMTGQNLPGFPYLALGGTMIGSTLVNFGGGTGLDIIYAGSASVNCPIIILKNDGTVLRETTIPSAVRTELAVIDLYKNGVPYIVFGDGEGNIWVKNSQLEDMPGFPKKVSSRIESSPVFDDFDNDGIREIIFGDQEGYIHILKPTGQYIDGYPLKVSNSPIRRSPWVGRFEPARGDILLTVSGGIDYIDTKMMSFAPAWNTFRGNIGKTASVNDVRTPDEDILQPVYTNSLGQNYPNPFNPETTISFSILNSENVKLSIYNIRGQLVKTLLNENMSAGHHLVNWNGTDNIGNNVSSGLYFYRIETNSFSDVKRMLLMK